MIRDLGNPAANDLSAHHAALTRFAQQYLDYCRDCKLRCHPDVRRCGYVGEATGQVRHRDGDRYRIIGRDQRWGDALQCSNEKENRFLLSEYSTDWRIDGEPAVKMGNRAVLLDSHIYSKIVPSARITPPNLATSFSGLCLAGRVRGESATREVCSSMRFRTSMVELSLSEILTIHGWTSSESPSRVTFYNPRTKELDRYVCAPTVVVADGDTSFLQVVGSKRFQQSDVIGVVHRTLERDRLENVGNKMLDLLQWYVEDHEQAERLRALPSGITVSIVKRRNL